jgi:hypothetical protein
MDQKQTFFIFDAPYDVMPAEVEEKWLFSKRKSTNGNKGKKRFPLIVWRLCGMKSP